MNVVVLDTPEKHAQGVLPYEAAGPLSTGAIFFFKNIRNTQSRLVDGAGMRGSLRVYALDHWFRPIPTRGWPWFEGAQGPELPGRVAFVLRPNMRAMLPYNAAHMVETSEHAPVLTDFGFLARY